jgi:hypothetical protein
MFWSSVLSGLVLLLHWQVWVAVVLYVSVSIVFLIAVAAVMGRDESGGRMAVGCLFQMIGGTVLHGILMGILVAFLLPIILGGSSATPFSVIVGWLLPVAKIGVIAIVVVTIAGLVPFVGGFIAASPGIQAFLEGVIIFTALSASAIEQIMSDAKVQGNVYPGFWECIGFLVIAGILVRLIMLASSLILGLTVDPEKSVGGLMIATVTPALGVLGGIIPLFMYGSYIRLSVGQLVRG